MALLKHDINEDLSKEVLSNVIVESFTEGDLDTFQGGVLLFLRNFKEDALELSKKTGIPMHSLELIKEVDGLKRVLASDILLVISWFKGAFSTQEAA